MPLKITRVQGNSIRIRAGSVVITVIPLRGKGARDRITVRSPDPISIEPIPFGRPTKPAAEAHAESVPDAPEGLPDDQATIPDQSVSPAGNMEYDQHFPDCIELPGKP